LPFQSGRVSVRTDLARTAVVLVWRFRAIAGTMCRRRARQGVGHSSPIRCTSKTDG